MYRKLLALTGAILLSCAAGEAFAYTLLKCGTKNLKWSTNVYAPRASAVGFPVGSWRNALAYVVSRMNSNPSLLGYTISYDDPGVGLGNGQSEVWWSSGFGAPAVTNWWYNTSSCTFIEADIRFDNTVAYHYTTSKSSLSPYGGAFRPFQTTAIHEFGHAGGLGHTATTYSVMGQDWDHIHANCGIATAYPGEDMSAGLIATYGLWAGAPQDLGAAHWRHTGSSGEYSTHARTRIFNSAGVELAKVCAGCAEPVYRVNKGQIVQLELTYENMGRTSPLTSPVGYYVSTNDCISTGDTFLGSTSMTLGRDTAFTWRRTLTIPNTLTSGQNYWLGAIIDYTGATAEGYESNNATYVGIRVQ